MKSSSAKLRRRRPLLGTFVEIELRGDVPNDRLNYCITEAFDAMADIDRLMSYHRPESDLSRLNQAPAGAWVRLDRRTIEVLQSSNALYRQSQGLFDIRCGGPLADAGILPTRSGKLKQSFRTYAPSAPVEIRGSRACKTGPWVLDLGGIAKGYAVDCAVKTIQILSRGIHLVGIVNAGGDLRVWGEDTVLMNAMIQGRKPYLRPIPVTQTAAAVSSVRRNSDRTHRFAPSAQVRMPSGEILNEEKTAMVFAQRCLWADALTKVALLGSPDMAAQTLSRYRARALVFWPDGELERAIN